MLVLCTYKVFVIKRDVGRLLNLYLCLYIFGWSTFSIAACELQTRVLAHVGNAVQINGVEHLINAKRFQEAIWLLYSRDRKAARALENFLEEYLSRAEMESLPAEVVKIGDTRVPIETTVDGVRILSYTGGQLGEAAAFKLSQLWELDFVPVSAVSKNDPTVVRQLWVEGEPTLLSNSPKYQRAKSQKGGLGFVKRVILGFFVKSFYTLTDQDIPQDLSYFDWRIQNRTRSDLTIYSVNIPTLGVMRYSLLHRDLFYTRNAMKNNYSLMLSTASYEDVMYILGVNKVDPSDTLSHRLGNISEQEYESVLFPYVKTHQIEEFINEAWHDVDIETLYKQVDIQYSGYGPE